mmetsp:Transcript_13652/g.24475  ORF Transcript_13652/g.24475 Transcript_13652/m.24475 type:complete len:546 (-) Transcript_13652:58-1695(-)|eukprot:CAMPEP_0182443580 /NCGR_PEP_ID=MMETSP1172-20130603/2284_1 /TAXON_ID=708627 /ORGANISM="Timspurckia oligopyrenoides, Strain CCMP3278" /LENGTH=545 /DNA_ID=CAMNT_0024638911 /DNA_START=205 /DNA_END=1842 /DNA_ORIENTATION=+
MKKLMNKVSKTKIEESDSVFGKTYICINGSDSVDSNAEPTERVDNIEIGTRIYGTLITFLDELPASTHAFVKFKFKGLYTQYKMFHYISGNPPQEMWVPEHKKFTFYTKVHKWCMPPSFVSSTKNADGKYELRYPFALDIDSSLGATFDDPQLTKNVFKDKSKKLNVWYKLRAKVFYDGNKDKMFKSPFRELGLVAQRPTFDELTKSPEAVSGIRKNKLMSSLIKSQVDVEMCAERCCFLEGHPVSVIVKVENPSKKPVVKGMFTLRRVISRPMFHYGLGRSDIEDAKVKTEIVSQQLLGLGIGPGESIQRSLTVEIPAVLQFFSSEFHIGEDYFKVEYFVRIDLKIPGPNIIAECPIKISPNSKQYLVSFPSDGQVPGSGNYLSSVAPEMPMNYMIMPQIASQLPATSYPKVKYFCFTLLSGNALPKVGGIFGKTDPYVTCCVNDQYFRVSSIQKKTQDPQWNQTFRIYLSGEELTYAPTLKFTCYFFDSMRDEDELVGHGTITADMTQRGKSIPVLLEIDDPKKPNTKKPRGSLSISYDFLET